MLGGVAMSHTRVSFLIPNQLMVLLPPPLRSRKTTPPKKNPFVIPLRIGISAGLECFLHRAFTLGTVFTNLLVGGEGASRKAVTIG